MKKNRGDEPIGVIIHIHMEISQGNSLVVTFISNKQKCHLFLFFFFILLQNKRTGGWNRSYCWGEVQWAWGGGRKEGKRLNSVQIL
jgi:hypothetical protein